MKIKKWFKENKNIWIGGGIGVLIGFILLTTAMNFLNNYSLYGGYPIWITLTYFIPLSTFFILIWIPLGFLGINLGSLENPSQFILIIRNFYFILFYFRIIDWLYYSKN